jgi:hypothetical protein
MWNDRICKVINLEQIWKKLLQFPWKRYALMIDFVQKAQLDISR